VVRRRQPSKDWRRPFGVGDQFMTGGYMSDRRDDRPAGRQAVRARPLPDLRSLPRMVGWFGFTALYSTGVHSVLSKVFGSYSDQRLIQALADKASVDEIVKRYDYSALDCSASGAARGTRPDGEVWVDYLADTGDGFDSTFAIASLVAARSLEIEGAGEPLPGGQLLVMGGDQVYPFASLDQYEARLLTPFRLADTETQTPNRKLFAIPGNHDWYDGLSAFDRLFCRARYGDSDQLVVGPWKCEQHRSYFAIKLPHNWWIWGLDTQLTRNFDMGQIEYFRAVSRHMMDREKAKIIICIPEPSWYETAETGDESGYPESLSKILPTSFEHGEVCAVIAGDWHHYSRYVGVQTGLNLITAGGGGAFLAPTHHLPETLNVSWGGEEDDYTCRIEPCADPDAPRTLAREHAVFPTKSASRRLSWRLLAFPYFNAAYAFTLGVAYWLMTWIFTASPVSKSWFENLDHSGQKADEIARTVIVHAGSLPVAQWMLLVVDAASNNFLLFLLGAGSAAAFYMLADARRIWARLLLALGHWSAHAVAMCALTSVFATFNDRLDAMAHQGLKAGHQNVLFAYDLIRNSALFAFEMIVFGGLAAGLIWGVYFFICCRFFNLHLSQAFAALRIAGYKHFLRMKIEPDRLTIYPIGLRKVPFRLWWRRRTGDERRQGVRAAFVSRTGLRPRLIEPPVVITPSTMRQPGNSASGQSALRSVRSS
jgi:hypothetical protein